jgi:excisionase family DNA binding protein
MEESPEQLSLPLFESGATDDRPRSAREGGPIDRVVRSRSQSQPAEDGGHAEEALATTGPALLTTREAADLLRVHPRTVQRLVERGQLSAIHLGTAVRFDRADLAELTGRLKRRAAAVASPTAAVVRPGRAVRISFADRLRSQQDEHRAA